MSIYRTPHGARLLQQWCRTALSVDLPGAVGEVVTTPLGPTHITLAGTAGPTVVLVPGTNLNAATSVPLVRALAVGHRVVVADVPGQPGLSSEHRPDGDRVGAHRDWIDAVLAAVDVHRAVLVGESLGAAIALGATPGDRVGGIVAVAPAGLVGASITPRMLATSLPWLLNSSPARAGRMLDTLCGGAPVPDRARVVEWLHLVAVHARSSLAPGPLPTPVLSGWRDVPRRVVVGAHDVFFPPNRLQPVARRLLGVDVEVSAVGGHLLSHTDPAAVGATVRNLTSGVPPV